MFTDETCQICGKWVKDWHVPIGGTVYEVCDRCAVKHKKEPHISETIHYEIPDSVKNNYQKTLLQNPKRMIHENGTILELYEN